jgi:hypothetical protein
MIEPNALDSLVRFAAAGASGVAILAIVFVGYVISKTTPETHPEKYKLIKSYMWMSVVVAIISGVSGILNFSINQNDVTKVEEAVVGLVFDTEEIDEEKAETITDIVRKHGK